MILKSAVPLIILAIMQESSFLALRNWVENIDIQRFEVLLCVGNKVDLVPGHAAHVEYRRRMQRIGESSADPHPEYFDFGINENEGCGLLSEEEPRIEIRDSTSQWCIEQNIEYIEACASNADFDKCKWAAIVRHNPIIFTIISFTSISPSPASLSPPDISILP
jgi:hypothetical protein